MATAALGPFCPEESELGEEGNGGEGCPGGRGLRSYHVRGRREQVREGRGQRRPWPRLRHGVEQVADMTGAGGRWKTGRGGWAGVGLAPGGLLRFSHFLVFC